MYHPSRGGVRGGSDQFEWESVKSDKHRENYLGHSLMAPVGRWQKNKDLQWFSRDKKGGSNSKEEEREAIRRMEADAMAAALGHAPVKRTGTSQLTKQELEEVFKKGQTERDERDIERIEGMGFGSTRASLMDSGSTKETLSAIGSQIPKEYSKQERRGQTNTDTKESKRDRKKEKKEKRKKKKKKSKSSKRSKRNDSSSDSDDSDRNTKRDRDRHRRRHSDDEDDKNTKSKAKRTRHDSTSDSESDSRNVRKSDLKTKGSRRRHDSTSDSESDSRNVRKSELKAKGSRRRHDSTSDDEPHSKKKHSSDRNKIKKRFSSDDEHKRSSRHHDRKEPRRQRHDSYSD